MTFWGALRRSAVLSQSPELMRRVSEGEAKELSNWKTLRWKKDEILHSADAPFRMTEKKRVRRCPEPKPWAYAKGKRRNDPLCHLFYLSPWGEAEGSPKGILRSLTLPQTLS